MADSRFGGYKASPTGALLHSDPSLFRGLLGPIGSGKSVTCCWELFRLARMQRPNADGVRKSRWAIIRQTYPELKSTTIRTWQDWFPPSICPIRYDAPITGHIKLPWADGTTIDMEIVFLALEREEDAKKLLSLELTGAWVNEAREVPYRIVEALMGRIGRYPAKRDGGHSRKCVIADTNPPDDDHWWYEFAEEETPENWRFFHQPPAILKLNDGSYVPNPDAENIEHLTDGARYYMDQIPGKDPEWIKVYLMGQYGTIQDGKPVYGESFNDSWHSAKVPLLPIKHAPVVLAFDFGLTPACCFLQQMPSGQVRVLDEIVTESSGVRQMCESAVLPLIHEKYSKHRIVVTGDPAGSQRSQADERTAYEILHELLGEYVEDIIPCDTNATEARLDSVKQLLNRNVEGKPMFMLSPECKLLRRGFMGAYKYRKIAAVGGSTRYSLSPEKNMSSHVHDSLQYGCRMIVGSTLKSAYQVSPPLRAARMPVGDAVAGY